jgi:hypothetical protein
MGRREEKTRRERRAGVITKAAPADREILLACKKRVEEKKGNG